ncbi:MAG: UDP-N-acetylmuramate dehydrogenase [Acutalibacteraceae bacterium]
MKPITDFLSENKIRYNENESMKLHTSFRIGGDAKIFVFANNLEQLQKTLCFCRDNEIRVFVIGNGSNLLISDNGLDAVVIKLCGDFEDIRLIDETTIEAGAGANLSAVCKFALANGLSGLEFAYGIPGSVGGAAYMNAGAYGGEMKDVADKCFHITPDGKTGELKNEKLDFGYRKSAYTTNGCIITKVLFRLNKGNKDEIKEKMDDLLNRRVTKQPLEYPSAGSVFRRPEGYFAGALIELSGLKGRTVGGAQVSEKHAGFIINIGDATCEDVKKLIGICQETVKEKFSVQLETEIKIF